MEKKSISHFSFQMRALILPSGPLYIRRGHEEEGLAFSALC